MFERLIDRLTNPEFHLFLICFIITIILTILLFYIFDIIFARKKININYYKMSLELSLKSIVIGSIIGFLAVFPALITLKVLGFNFRNYEPEIFLFAIGMPSLTITSILITFRKIIINGIDISKLNEELETKIK
jgi:hypothetical protein